MTLTKLNHSQLEQRGVAASNILIEQLSGDIIIQSLIFIIFSIVLCLVVLISENLFIVGMVALTYGVTSSIIFNLLVVKIQELTETITRQNNNHTK